MGLRWGGHVGAVIDVVHALQARVVPRVHFQDHLVGLVQPGLVVAHRGRGDQPPVGQHARHLDHGHVELAQKTEPHKLRHMRQVNVHILHVPRIDLAAHRGVGLVGQAHFDAVHLRQGAIQLGRGAGACPQPDLEALALGVKALDAAGQRPGDGLGVARAGEAAHADMGSGRDQRRGLVGGHGAGKKVWVQHPIGERHRRARSVGFVQQSLHRNKPPWPTTGLP